MPVQRCQVNGRPGFKYGANGTCYVYTKGNTQSRVAARERAARQGRAIEASKARRAEQGQ
jgi:hypothetical protein